MKETDQDAFLQYFNKVKFYLEMEYDENIVKKMETGKYVNVCKSYIKNCYSLKKNIPYTANGVAVYLKNSL